MQLGGLRPRGLGHPGLAPNIRGGPAGGKGAALAASQDRSRPGKAGLPGQITAEDGFGLQAPGRRGPQAWVCPRITKGAYTPRPGAAVAVARAGVIFRYSRSVLP